MKLKVFSHPSEIPLASWEDLAHSSNSSVFSSSAWITLWADTIASRLDKHLTLRIYCIYIEDYLSAIIPLVSFRFFGLNILFNAGLSRSDYHEIVLRNTLSDHDIHKALHLVISEQPNTILILLRLPQIIKNSLSRSLEAHNSSVNFLAHPISSSLQHIYTVNGSSVPNIPSKKFFKRIKYIENRIKRDTGSLPIYSSRKPSHTDVEALLILKNRQCMRTGVTAQYLDPSVSRFYSEMSNYLTNSTIWTMSISDKGRNVIIARALTLSYQSTIYYLMPAYDPTLYAQYSPGLSLLFHIFTTSKSVYQELDLLAGCEDYKKRFSNRTTLLYLSVLNSKKNLLTSALSITIFLFCRVALKIYRSQFLATIKRHWYRLSAR